MEVSTQTARTIKKGIALRKLNTLHIFKPVNFGCRISTGFALQNRRVSDFNDPTVGLNLSKGEKNRFQSALHRQSCLLTSMTGKPAGVLSAS